MTASCPYPFLPLSKAIAGAGNPSTSTTGASTTTTTTTTTSSSSSSSSPSSSGLSLDSSQLQSQVESFLGQFRDGKAQVVLSTAGSTGGTLGPAATQEVLAGPAPADVQLAGQSSSGLYDPLSQRTGGGGSSPSHAPQFFKTVEVLPAITRAVDSSLQQGAQVAQQEQAAPVSPLLGGATSLSGIGSGGSSAVQVTTDLHVVQQQPAPPTVPAAAQHQPAMATTTTSPQDKAAGAVSGASTRSAASAAPVQEITCPGGDLYTKLVQMGMNKVRSCADQGANGLPGHLPRQQVPPCPCQFLGLAALANATQLLRVGPGVPAGLTVFAPPDESLGAVLSLLANASASSSSGSASVRSIWANLLFYHMVPESVGAAALPLDPTLETLEGSLLHIARSPAGALVNNATVLSSIPTCNGQLYVVSQQLVPAPILDSILSPPVAAFDGPPQPPRRSLLEVDDSEAASDS